MQLAILHYHLLPGGVTGVIVEGTRAILRFMQEIERVTIVCGRHENVEAVRGLVLSGMDTPAIRARFSIEVVPEIDYSDHGGSSNAGAIRNLLMDRFCAPDIVLLIHNFQLGKNPAFTRAVADIALENPSQRVIFQIHDFPECARYENLARLNREVAGTVYPSTANVRYALINGRDKALLTSAGISEVSVRLLENPVEVLEMDSESNRSTIPRRSAAEVRERLFGAFGPSFPGALPDAPIMLYPVRTIRRKNVLEAGFLAAAQPAPVNLLVTLPGISVQEHLYSEMVAQTYNEGLVPGLWGFGREMERLGLSFFDVVNVADIVISSSVQEGFGYQFIHAVTWGKPLLARYLDTLESVLPVFSDYPHQFYTDVRVPFSSPSIRSLRPYLALRYSERIDILAENLPETAVNALREEISALLSTETVDFSYLPVQVQYSLLKDLRHPEYLEEIRGHNSQVLTALSGLLATRTEPRAGRVMDRFGPAAYVDALRQIIDSFAETDPRGDRTDRQNHEDTSVRRNLVQAFARAEYSRLLFEPLDGTR